ncbi:MAG: hypothetical protein JWP44_4309, partial [Mucilaginibacter sp.]|nr:hypothetical protein [Mucilaginibacter sp.]
IPLDDGLSDYRRQGEQPADQRH